MTAWLLSGCSNDPDPMDDPDRDVGVHHGTDGGDSGQDDDNADAFERIDDAGGDSEDAEPGETDTGDVGDTSDGDDDAGDANGDDDAGDVDDTAPQSSLTAAEQELYELINAYRVENGLSEIPISYSLTVVARAHVQDLIDYGSEILIPGQCNLHSWSDNGPWTGCCYDPDHSQAACIWNKPSELTNYAYTGYEISVGAGGGGLTPQHALNIWKGSSGHRDVILNQNTWSIRTWRAIGVGIDGGYSHVWFGEGVDPDDFP